MLLKGAKAIENSGHNFAHWTCDWLQRYGWEVVGHPPTSADLASSDFHLFGSIKKGMPVLRFAIDADVKQAAAC